MAVHFVYRCPYQGPSERFVACHPDATVLAWFQSRCDDLAIGLAGLSYGQVQVVFGSRTGLSTTRQTTILGPTVDGAAARFGAAITSGDFDCDGFGDLAVAAPEADVGVLDAGQVTVYSGRSTGIATVGTRHVQSAFGDAPEAGDRFGAALGVGDLDGEPGTCGCDDLVIAAPYEDWDGVADAGLVHVAYGGRSGVAAGGSDLVAPIGVLGPLREQGLGSNLAVGDVDLDGIDDLSLTLSATDQLAWLAGGRAGVGPATIEREGVPVNPVCETEVKGKVEIIDIKITFGPFDCDPCCGEGSCCIGGSCGG
jgi:hypothetical protein